MTTTRMFGAAFALLGALAMTGCSKKDDKPAAGSAAAPAKSGLAWQPDNYDKMSEPCKKTLACCIEMAKAEGAAKAEDFNLKCSGPAMWKDDECTTDLKSRVAMLEGKPVPDACK